MLIFDLFIVFICRFILILITVFSNYFNNKPIVVIFGRYVVIFISLHILTDNYIYRYAKIKHAGFLNDHIR